MLNNKGRLMTYLALLSLFMGGVCTDYVFTQETAPEKRYSFSGLELVFLRDHPDLPRKDLLFEAEPSLIETEWGYDAYDQSGKSAGTAVSLSTLRDLESTRDISARALRRITEALVQKLRSIGYMGVLVNIHPEDIDDIGNDLRPDGRSQIRLLIHLAQVNETRTIAMGQRLQGETNKNRKAHRWIRESSPLKPGKNTQPDDLLRKDLLDEYSQKLSRHPGRRVDAAIGRVKEGKASIDYMVTENKPWNAFVQVSDTGTANTDKVRERFGFIHNQLTGNDDILNLNVSTAEFDVSNSVNVSYEFPLDGRAGDQRLKLSGGWSEFTASDIGLLNTVLQGRTWSSSISYTHNILQKDAWFLDARAGLKWEEIHQRNQTFNTHAQDEFIKPSIGLDLERSKRTSNTTGSLTWEGNLPGLAGTDTDEIAGLGRNAVDRDWSKLSLSFSHSFYLEPLLYGKDWENPETPETSTLAHELRFSTRAQKTWSRLISQEKMVIGGLHSVRGYPQSTASGDSGFFSSLEYRFHIPRIFSIDKDPEELPFFDTPFRMAPERVYGFPDWDLVATLFTDYGQTSQNDTLTSTEFDEELWSVGTGLELSLKRNLRVQWSWGYVLTSMNATEIEQGHNEVNLVITLTY